MKVPYKPKKRNSHSRKRKSVILIAAEGDNKTECNYFSAFSKKSFNLKFTRGNETDPVKLAQRLRKEYAEQELTSELNDKVFCVVDEDISPLQEKKIEEAKSILKRINGIVIVSNPCFEVWYLCHFTVPAKQFVSSKEVIETLQKQHISTYTKGYPKMYELLSPRTYIAIDNAKKLEKYHRESGSNLNRYYCQPKTDVYIIVEFLLKMNESR